MNKTSRTITGIVAVIIGIFALFAKSYFSGAFIIIIGIIIFFNKNEDEIEKIKK